LLGQVALGIIGVRVNTVVGELVAGAGGVSSARPIAVGVIAPVVGAVAGELIGVVVGIRRGRAVVGFRGEPAGIVIHVGVVGEERRRAVAMQQVREPVGRVVDEGGRADELLRAGAFVAFSGRGLVGGRVGKVLFQHRHRDAAEHLGGQVVCRVKDK